MRADRLAPGIIINADDLGLHPQINAGIVSAYRNGVLTSGTMLVTTPYFEDTIREVIRPAILPVGLHLSLTQGKAVAPAAELRDLVDEEGNFTRSAGQLMLRSYTSERGRRILAQIRAEFRAQLSRARDHSLHPTHVDSHQHIHMTPAIFAVLQEEARKFGITRIRFCREPLPGFALHLDLIPAMRRRNHVKWLLIRALGRGICPTLSTAEYFFGILYSGIISKRVLLALLAWSQPEFSIEIGIHPGFPPLLEEVLPSDARFARFMSSSRRREEHDVLVDPEIATMIRQRGLQLRSYDGTPKATV